MIITIRLSCWGYPDPRHFPTGPTDNPLFLLDDDARPTIVAGQPAPLPMQFFAIDDAAGLREYVADLNQREREACEKLYAAAAEASK